MRVFISLLAVLPLLPVSDPAEAYQYGGHYPVAYRPYQHMPAYRLPARAAPMPYYGYVQPGSQRYPVPGDKPQTSDRDQADTTDRPTAGSTVLGEGKQGFIDELLPHVEQENRRLSRLREEVSGLLNRQAYGTLDDTGKQRLRKLAASYRIDDDPVDSASARQALLHRIDIIPSSLALAQAANESAWGKSRFAREANNLFGIWTYDEDKGLKPRNREAGKTHLVRIFDDYGDSVRYYMHLLNSHPAYADLREIRVQLRTSQQTIDGHSLASGLDKYSAKGKEYVDLIQSLIRQNEWARLDVDNQPV